MPRFLVVLEGRGLDAPTHKGGPIRGFFVRRIVEAPTEADARTQALAGVATDWTAGPYAAWGQLPAVEAVETRPAGRFSRFLVNRKYVFHRGL